MKTTTRLSIYILLLLSCFFLLGYKMYSEFQHDKHTLSYKDQNGYITDDGGYYFTSMKTYCNYADGRSDSLQILCFEPDTTINSWMGHERISISTSDFNIDGKLDKIRLWKRPNYIKKQKKIEVLITRNKVSGQWEWECNNKMIQPSQLLTAELSHAIRLFKAALDTMK